MAEIIHNDNDSCLILMTAANIELILTNWGAAIYLIRMDGDDITLSCDDLNSFINNKAFFGATVGRTVNRIKNGRFLIKNKEYQLTINDNGNSAHGGACGFSAKKWNYEILDRRKVKFSLHSPDGDEGYPGDLSTNVIYELTDEGEIVITHEAVSNRDTIVSYTNHTYWCLGGYEKVYREMLMINADKYLETDDELIPTGSMINVAGSPFDFSALRKIGEFIDADHPSIKNNYGYDVSFVRRGNGEGLAAVLRDDITRRCLEVYTTYPCIHVYTGNFLDGEPGKGGRVYEKHDATCLECSFFPDAINHPNFGGMELEAGKILQETIRYKLYHT